MALDHQKPTYTRKKGDTKKRTSYARMHNWYEYSDKGDQSEDANPYTDADKGIFRKLQPKLDVPLHESEHFSYNHYKLPTERWTPNMSGPRGTPRLGSVEPVWSPTSRTVKPKSLKIGEFAPWSQPVDVLNLQQETTTTIPHVEAGPVSGQYYKSGGYDDYHKSFMRLQKLGVSPTYPKFGPPRLRNGRNGGSWRHIKEVLQAKGHRTYHVDGVPRGYDNIKIANEEAPAINLIQPVYKSDPSARYVSPRVQPWTANDLEAFRASEAGNYFIMR